MRQEKYPDRIACEDFVIYENKMYFSSLNCNAFYRCNLDGSSVEYIMSFPNEKIDIRHLHGAMYTKKGKIYFAPMNGKCVAIYDVIKDEITSIDVTDKVRTDNSKYFSICSYKNKLYMIPSRTYWIIEVDTNSDEISFHNEWMRNIDFFENQEIPAIKNGAFLRKEKLYLPFSRKSILVEIELENFTSTPIQIGTDNNGFTDAFFDENEDVVWLLKYGESSIVRYSFSTQEETVFHLKESDKAIKCPYIKMIEMGNKLIVIPYQESDFICLDMQLGEVSCLKHLDQDIQENEWGAYYYTAKKIADNKFLAVGAGDYMWEEYGKQCDLLTSYSIEDDDMVARILTSENIILKETAQLGLPFFLKCITK